MPETRCGRRLISDANQRSARRLALILWGINVVSLRIIFLLGWRDDTCREHHLLDRRDRHRRRLEVAEPVAERDRQRRPSELVASVPDLDLRALLREELEGSGKILEGS